MGIENSRRFRALAAYCALVSVGADGYREIVDRNVDFARKLASWMAYGEGQKLFEVLNLSENPVGNASAQSVVPLNIILFRARDSTTASSGKLQNTINKAGQLYLTPGPNHSLRIAVSNWQTGEAYDHNFDAVITALKTLYVGQ